VVLTQKRTDISGTVIDAANRPIGDYVAVLFPEDRALWTGASRFIAAGRPDQKGMFRILGLPPGRYRAAAVEYVEPGEERDPQLLSRLMNDAQRLR
jgi:hypothetical protein